MKKRILHTFFPERCVCCGKVVPFEKCVCEDCDNLLPRVKSKVCRGCANSVENCSCATMKRVFNGMVSPFIYDKGVKSLIRKIKYDINADAYDYAARNMVRSLLTLFPDIRFDVVCCVPMSNKEKQKRGLNPAEKLAKLIAKSTFTDYEPLLVQTREKLVQHELPASQRAVNVAGLYKCTRKLKDENVLLIDDICTTGATLNECSRVLLQNNAHGVWCLVVARASKAE